MIETLPYQGFQVPVVRSAALGAAAPELVFGLSTRRGGASRAPLGMNLSFRVGDDESAVRENRERFFGALGIGVERLAIPSQVHGDVVRCADAPGEYPACDGLVSASSEVYLAVSVADCVPVFVVDPSARAVGAFHAGWRGARAGIVAAGMALLRERCGADPARSHAVVGQSAGACCYEVGEEVAAQFEPRFVVRRPGRKPTLDLHAHARAALEEAGVPATRIEMLSECTICHPEAYHSYRRDADGSGRMMGVIGFRRPGAR